MQNGRRKFSGNSELNGRSVCSVHYACLWWKDLRSFLLNNYFKWTERNRIRQILKRWDDERKRRTNNFPLCFEWRIVWICELWIYLCRYMCICIVFTTVIHVCVRYTMVTMTTEQIQAFRVHIFNFDLFKSQQSGYIDNIKFLILRRMDVRCKAMQQCLYGIDKAGAKILCKFRILTKHI